MFNLNHMIHGNLLVQIKQMNIFEVQIHISKQKLLSFSIDTMIFKTDLLVKFKEIINLNDLSTSKDATHF